MTDPNVTYYPFSSRTDPSQSSVKSLAKRRSPLLLFTTDVWLLLKDSWLIPYLFLPRKTAATVPVPVNKARAIFDRVVEVVLALIEVLLLLVVPLAGLLLPGWVFLIVLAIAFLIVWGIASLTWGSLIVNSTVDVDGKEFGGEKWVFLNGFGTSHARLVEECNILAKTFQRPVMGVHNRSWGILGDVTEALIQRSLAYDTLDERIAEASIRECLEDPNIKRLVVIAHSQGGIILSLLLDHLYALLPGDLFSKLEIYTFASAAAHFHNPMKPLKPVENTDDAGQPSSVSHAVVEPSTMPPGHADRETLIPVIEHYVNAKDLVPRWGVLRSMLISSKDPYAGIAFVHENASGHSFVTHYLSNMFNILQLNQIRDDDPAQFLNHAVQLPQDGDWGILGTGTPSKAPGMTPSPSTNGQSQPKLRTLVAKDQGVSTSGPKITVKQMSRLWKYLDGGQP